jgi:hypothetical protein
MRSFSAVLALLIVSMCYPDVFKALNTCFVKKIQVMYGMKENNAVVNTRYLHFAQKRNLMPIRNCPI